MMSFDGLSKGKSLSFGDVLWEGVRSATGYSHEELQQLPAIKDAAAIKPCIESLDLVDCSWADRAVLQKLRDDLEKRLACRRAFLVEKAKRGARKFDTKNYIEDKRYEAALQRDRDASFGAAEALLRFRRIDLSGRGIKSTDEATMGALLNVAELTLTDNDITLLTALPPATQLAVLASNEIHRVAFRPGVAYPALVALSLAGNCLRTLDFVDALPNLCALDASFNCITSVEKGAAPPAVLRHKSLSELQLQGNPVTLLPDYRPRLEALLLSSGSSSVKTVDGQGIQAPPNLSHLQFAHLAAPSLAARKNSGDAAAAADPNSNSGDADQKPAVSVHLQVLGVKGFTELATRSFDLNAAASKCCSLFYTPAMMSSIATQAQMAVPPDAKGGRGGGGGGGGASGGVAKLGGGGAAGAGAGGGGGAAAAALAAQQAAAGGAVPPHELALQQWCQQVGTSLKMQALWMGEERGLLLDDLLQVTAAAATEEQQAALAATLASAKPPPFLSVSAPAAAAQALKEAQAAAQAAAIAQAQAISGGRGAAGGGGGGKDKHGGKSGGGGAAAAGKAGANAADALSQREQAVRNALHAASAEFIVPDPASALRPTLAREMMIPLRVGLVFAVTSVGAPTPLTPAITTATAAAAAAAAAASSTNSAAAAAVPSMASASTLTTASLLDELPVATIGWASLGPAELLGNSNNAQVQAKVTADRATLITARERVSKLTQQLVQIRDSLEAESQEFAWRRDTEFFGGGAAASGVNAASNNGGGGGVAASSKRGGPANARGGAGGAKAPPGSPAAGGAGAGNTFAPVNAADAAAMDAFLQSQQQGRRRAEDVMRRLVLETAALSMVEALERNASSGSSSGGVSVEGRFSLCKPGYRAGGQEGSATGGSTGDSAREAGAAAAAGGAGAANKKPGANAGAAGAAAGAGSAAAAKKARK